MGEKLAEDGGDAIAPFRIFFVMTIEENGMRAKLGGGAERHGGMDAEFAGFVAGGGDDAALIGAATDDDGFAAKIGPIEQFDGNEEGVHVHVENGGMERDVAIVEGIVLGAESSQVRHEGRVRACVAKTKGQLRGLRKRREGDRSGPKSRTSKLGGEDAVDAGQILGDR